MPIEKEFNTFLSQLMVDEKLHDEFYDFEKEVVRQNHWEKYLLPRLVFFLCKKVQALEEEKGRAFMNEPPVK